MEKTKNLKEKRFEDKYGFGEQCLKVILHAERIMVLGDIKRSRVLDIYHTHGKKERKKIYKIES